MTPFHPQLAALLSHELHAGMGLTCHASAGGRSHLSFTVQERMLTPAGALHAGYLYTACDFASYAALLSELAPGAAAVTHDIHLSLMQTARPGEQVDIRAGIVRKGRTLAFLDAAASVGDRLLADARVTKSLLKTDA